MKPFTLSNPPIVEAVIQFNVDLETSVDLETIKDALPTEMLPNLTSIQNLRYNLGPDAQSSSSNHMGYLLRSSDYTKTSQFRIDRYTASFVNRYTEWDELVNHFNNEWERYVKIFKPARVTQVSVRFINRIELPMDMGDRQLEEYIPCLPSSPDGLLDAYLSFNGTIRMIDPEKGIRTAISQQMSSTEQSRFDAEKRCVPFILDIDCAFQSNYAIDAKKIRETLEKLREQKNTAFFNSVTTESLKPYA